MKNNFFPTPWNHTFHWKWGEGGFQSMDFFIVVIFVFVVFRENQFSVPKLAGMLDFVIFQRCVVEMDVKSYQFGELIVNLASWTPRNFGRYPKCPKWSYQSRPMTDFVRKSPCVRPHHPSLFLSLRKVFAIGTESGFVDVYWLINRLTNWLIDSLSNWPIN